MKRFGCVTPLVVDDSNMLLCGHARLEAAAHAGFTQVPVVRASHLSESDKRAFILADNKLAELASWNKLALRRELHFLSELDIDFDFSAIGFNTAEVDFILERGDEADDQADTVSRSLDLPVVTRFGDLWQVGEHRLYCGSALDSSSYEALLAGDRADMVFTDPPYNVRINGHASRTQGRREFGMASMSPEQFEDFLRTSVERITNTVNDGAICFVCMDWRHFQELARAAQSWELKNLCVWIKNNPGMGSLYRSQHEFVFAFKCGAANHINNVELGRYGRNRSNVWDYAGLTSFGRDRDKLLGSHPTVKPVALVADAIKDCSRRGDVILDPFGGSGTTIIAAEKTKRRAAVIEIDPLYVDVAVRRWEALTGRDAVCARTGRTFNECGQEDESEGTNRE
jgi:DNA modification methylase